MQIVTAEARAEVVDHVERAGLDVTTEAADRLAAFAQLIEKWNRVYNLTGIRDRRLLLERHIVESLALAPLLRGERIADVGTGAGLPGMPLAIIHPQRHFTLIESRRKRVNFLHHVVRTLALDNVTVAHGRAEDLSSPAPFATVLARAVAPPAELLKIIKPLTAPGSILVLLTSTEVAQRIVAIADDFSEVPLPADLGKPLRGRVIVLERLPNGRTIGSSRIPDG